MGMTEETVRCESCPKFFTCPHVFSGECKIVEPETKEYIEIIRCRNCRFWKKFENVERGICKLESSCFMQTERPGNWYCAGAKLKEDKNEA